MTNLPSSHRAGAGNLPIFNLSIFNRVELAVSTLCLYQQPDASISQLIRDNPSVRNWEIMDDGYHRLDKKMVRELQAMSADGLKFSVHAPFSSINPAEYVPSLRNRFNRILKDSISRAAEIGATVEVVHAGFPTIFSYFYPKEAISICASSLSGLVRYGKSLGVDVVVENGVGQYDLFNTVERIRGLLHGFDDIYTCLDVGHACITGDVAAFITGQPRICHIHVHDNNGQHDQHLPAGAGSIDWQETCRLLQEANYRGFLVAENHSIAEALRTLNYLQSILEKA